MSKGPRLSRLQKMRRERSDDLYMPPMPPMGVLGYLISYLYEIGPVEAAGSGAGPLTHREILAWCQLMGITLQPWETKLIRRLSLEYLFETHKAGKWDAQPPWITPDAKPVPTSSQLALRALARL